MRRPLRIAALGLAAGIVAVAAATAATVPAQPRPAFSLTVNHPGAAAIGQAVTLRAVCRRNNGTPIAGARVRFTWNLAGTAVAVVKTTNRNGVARSRRTMNCAGVAVVKVRATWNGKVRAIDPPLRWEVPGST